MNAIEVQKSRCVHVRNRHVACDRCVAVCPSGAMTVTDKGPLANADACLGCGACVTVCPTEALSLESYEPDCALAQVAACAEANDGRAVIACSQAVAADGPIDGAKAVEVPCLALVDESLIAGAASRGARHLTLACADCATCPSRVGCALAEKAVDRALALLAEVGANIEVAITESLPAIVWAEEDLSSEVRATEGGFVPSSPPDNPRRTARIPLVGALPQADLDARPLHARKGGMLPRLRSFRRDALLDGLWTLASSDAVSLVASEPSAFWPLFSLDNTRCNGCQACVKMCPTGALEPLYDGDDESVIGIEFFAGDCVQCGLCEAVCPHGAVAFEARGSLAQVLAGRTEQFEIGQLGYDLGTPDSMMEAMRLRLNCEVSAR